MQFYFGFSFADRRQIRSIFHYTPGQGVTFIDRPVLLQLLKSQGAAGLTPDSTEADMCERLLRPLKYLFATCRAEQRRALDAIHHYAVDWARRCGALTRSTALADVPAREALIEGQGVAIKAACEAARLAELKRKKADADASEAGAAKRAKAEAAAARAAAAGPARVTRGAASKLAAAAADTPACEVAPEAEPAEAEAAEAPAAELHGGGASAGEEAGNSLGEATDGEEEDDDDEEEEELDDEERLDLICREFEQYQSTQAAAGNLARHVRARADEPRWPNVPPPPSAPGPAPVPAASAPLGSQAEDWLLPGSVFDGLVNGGNNEYGGGGLPTNAKSPTNCCFDAGALSAPAAANAVPPRGACANHLTDSGRIPDAVFGKIFSDFFLPAPAAASTVPARGAFASDQAVDPAALDAKAKVELWVDSVLRDSPLRSPVR